MKRDDLLIHLEALPADAEIGVRIGDVHLDITDVASWGEENFVSLECRRADLIDAFREWRIPPATRKALLERKASDGHRYV